VAPRVGPTKTAAMALSARQHVLVTLVLLAAGTLSVSSSKEYGGEDVHGQRGLGDGTGRAAISTVEGGSRGRGAGGGGDEVGWEGAAGGIGVEWDGGERGVGAFTDETLSRSGGRAGRWSGVIADTFRRRLCGSSSDGGGGRREGDAWCEAFVGAGIRRESVVLYDVMVGLPTVLFVAFLASQLRSSVRKLGSCQNHIMTTYYCFLWLVCVLSVLRAGVQMWQASPVDHVGVWNALWLASGSGLTFLEVSVIVFLAQGYRADAGVGSGALVRTLAAATTAAGVDLAVKAALIFGGGIQLFVEQQEAQSVGYYWTKWGYWAARGAVFSVVYAAVVVLPHTAHRDLLPARPAFFRYAGVLLALYAAGTVAALCIAAGAGWGYCAVALCNGVYYAGYPPLLYGTFLRDYFREGEYELERAYYREMEEAGYFDDTGGNADY